MSQPDEFQLKTPDSVAADAAAVEILRIWWSMGQPVMSVKPAFNDPRQFGQVLALAAKHMAHGYNVRHGHDEKIAYNKILAGISDVLNGPAVETVVEGAVGKAGPEGVQ
ncbi:MAG: DUF5076 domain-containing protein [Alphaproteobacteria bacterium]|jgi:hypothetical protein|nr:DUF5076 domain-containing protein [Alphaproteobacteria bacterium]MBU2043094.1 DUF5076 domain-containing protein [Alphaproteobacteria bacterium]MBU2125066.1 DUF5076 domain-containing protein [Alphaproteobacteria bacterium]MBU2208361.1 DUF5076 domain-containing protein [Alphaproteobacteria bacterium]MBU2290239.1 DUF5076 domain-containing protein [Alphaproteobacteria bacterium]